MIGSMQFKAARALAPHFRGKENTESDNVAALDEVIAYLQSIGTWEESQLFAAHQKLLSDPHDKASQGTVFSWAFAGRWGALACPVIRMEQEWAASVCCSSIPPELWGVVLPPWDSFIIDIPPELGFKAWIARHEQPMDYVKVGYLKGMIRSALTDELVDGWYISPGTQEGNESRSGLRLRSDQLFSGIETDKDVSGASSRTLQLLGPLIGAVCMAFNSGDAAHNKRTHSKTRKWRTAQYPTSNEYMVGHPVVVGLTSHVARYIELGKHAGSKLSIQTLVRGHWKNQPCGSGAKERKFIHIEPYWRGPEDAPIAVRPHILKGSTE